MGRCETRRYGATRDGHPVDEYTLSNDRGMVVRFIGYAGVITAIEVPDRHGRVADVVLGLRSLAEYETKRGSFGALIGRYANRIGKARFELDGKTYQLPVNDPPNSLHGGTIGFSRRVWDVQPLSSADARLGLTSADGDNGYPGTVQVQVTYTLGDDDTLRIDYQASTDQATVINLTNHSYFNLAGNGAGSVENHLVMLNADAYTPVDGTGIPTGEIAPVDGTPLDLRQLTPISARLRSGFEQMLHVRGYDHNFVLNDWAPGRVRFAARAYEPGSGRVLDCYTDQPGVQFYTGNSLDGSVVGSAGTTYRQGDGFALETQHFPDSPNHPSFPTTVLRSGETFRSTTIFRFGTDSPFPETM